MDTIKVKKEELLAILKTNRAKHAEEYSESIKAYRIKAADLLAKKLDDVVNGKEFDLNFYEANKPQSYLKEYDLKIKMLEMAIEEVIELDHNEFNQLVNDEWHWKSSFQNSYMSNQAYGTSGSAGVKGASGSSGEYSAMYNLSGMGTTQIKFSDNEML